MKNKIIKILLLALSLFSGSISHAINVKYIKGTYEVLKPEYRHLSPVHGAVWWEKGLVEKYYRFGFYGKSIPKTKKGIARAPYGTVALIRDLFHEVQGSFNVTKSPSATAFHFSPETVAKILAAAEKYKGKPVTRIEQIMVQKKGKDIQVKKRTGLADDLKKVIKADTDFQASIKKYEPKYNELRKKVQENNKKEAEIKKKFVALIVEKKKIEDKSQLRTKEDTLALAEIEDQMETLTNQMAPIAQIKKEFGQYNIKDAQGRKLNILTNAIVASLQECGFVQSQKELAYPKETTHSILLAFLYRKAEKKSEFKDYFDELQNVLKKSILTEAGAKQVADKQWIADVFDDSNEGIKKILAEIKQVAESLQQVQGERVGLDAILNKISLAKIVFGEVSRPQALPHIAEYTDVFFEKVIFADCAETTMRNLSNIVTYNAKDNKFDIDKFKDADPKVKTFYQQYPNASELEAQNIHDAWVPVIENRPFVAYHKIVATNNPQKVAVAPSGTQGFIYGFGDGIIKKIKPEAVNISFNDGSSDALQKVKINEGEYIIVDPKQYHAFEVRPSLRNTIILMNQFFGLGLYKDLNIEFFKKDFNVTHLPQLTKKLGWEYDNVPGLDKNDYGGRQGLQIEITTGSGGTFLLSLKSDFHGKVEIISAGKVEEYQNKLSKLAVDTLLKNQSQVAVDLSCLYVSFYGLGLAQSVLIIDKKYQFMNYIFYSQNLNNPNTAVQMIKDLISIKSPVVLNLTAALLASLPVRQDLYYQNQVINSIAENQVYKNKDIKSALDNVVEKVMASEGEEKYDFMAKVAGIYFEKVIQLAKKGMKAYNIENAILGKVLELMIQLVQKGKGYDEGIEIALSILSDEYEFVEKNGYLTQRFLLDLSFDLLNEVVAKDKSIILKSKSKISNLAIKMKGLKDVQAKRAGRSLDKLLQSLSESSDKKEKLQE